MGTKPIADKREDTMLMKCIKKNDDGSLLSEIKELITDLSIQQLNMRDGEGYTAAFLACRYGRWDIARVLISAGADINIPNDQGNTLLHSICYQDRVDLFKR